MPDGLMGLAMQNFYHILALGGSLPEAHNMVNLIVQLIIVLLVAGFVYWIWGLLKPIIAQYVAEPFMSIVSVLILVLIGAIVLFWAIIPLLRALGGMVHL